MTELPADARAEEAGGDQHCEGELSADRFSADQYSAEEHCLLAMRNMHAFLHGELSEACADEVRRHLMACEKCMDNFDAEDFIGQLLRRCHGPAQAPATLRLRVSTLHVSWERK